MAKSISIKKTAAFVVSVCIVCLLFAGFVMRNNDNEKVLAANDETVIKLQIDNPNMTVNNETAEIDPGRETVPVIINDRTLLPVRSIIEAIGGTVGWEENTQTVMLNYKTDVIKLIINSKPAYFNDAENKLDAAPVIINERTMLPIRYIAESFKFTVDLEPETQTVTITVPQIDTPHITTDQDAPVVYMTTKITPEALVEIPVAKGTTITKDYVGAHLANYDSLISLAHFKGHAMAGFGGAIKNMSIGIGSKEGKAYIHTGGNSLTSPWGGDQDKFCESMAEATSGVVDFMDGKVVYINVMNRLSVDCDCDGNPAEPDMHDIGILASTDPLALDQACIDLVYAQKDGDGKSLVERIESRNGLHTLEHAAKIGLGSREYNLVNID